MTVEKVEGDKKEVEQITKVQFDELLNAVNTLKEENKVLKAHADETIAEKRAMKARLDEDQATRDKELEAKVNRTKEENEQLIKQYKEENNKLKTDIEASKQKEYQNKVREEASKLADKLTKDSIRKELLTEKFEKQIKLDDDGKVVVLDENKQPTISPVDVLVKSISDRYKCLIDGLDSTGGGAHSSGGTQPQKLSEMSEGDRVNLFRTDNAEYRRLEALE